MPYPLGDPATPLHAPSRGDGADALTDEDRLRAQQLRKARALAHDETGVRFESLALFAEPIFRLYDLDPSLAFSVKEHPTEADEVTVAVLETARVLWAYLSLPAQGRAARYDALAEALLGPNHGPDDEADLDLLLETVQAHWAAMTPEDLALAHSAETPPLDFDALLAHPAFAAEEAAPATERRYGPSQLNEMEARALFAQPLLGDATDPDALDAAMERAEEYWMLAQLHGLERGVYLQEIIDALALDEAEAARIREEAERMVRRFYELFPEQEPGHR